MKKKGILVLVLAIFIAGGVFAQTRPHKHESFDMLLGADVGFDLGFKSDIMQFDVNGGVNYDFYVFPWLSASTGLMIGPSLKLYKDEFGGYDFGSTNGGWYLTVPLSVHFNIPYVEWLYVGAGAGFNIPIATVGNGIKAEYYTSLPIDIGFDFSNTTRRAGARLFFRVIPNFYTDDTIMTYGLMWQLRNWKIFSKK